MNLVNEENAGRPTGRSGRVELHQHFQDVGLLLQDRGRGFYERPAHGAGGELGKSGLAHARRTEEKEVAIPPASATGRDRFLNRLHGCGVADKRGEFRWTRILLADHRRLWYSFRRIGRGHGDAHPRLVVEVAPPSGLGPAEERGGGAHWLVSGWRACHTLTSP